MIRRFRSFFGGIHPQYRKELSATGAIETLPLPDQVVVPLLQHIGKPAEPVVKVGDTVRTGQVVGTASGVVSVSVHATLSGTVTGIATIAHPSGREVKGVVIESDGADNWIDLEPCEEWPSLPPQAVRERVSAAGIAGLGGATFPTHVKLSPPEARPVDTLIVNGVECEPYLTADHRLMLEHTGQVVAGAVLVSRVLGVSRVIFGIEDNKPDAVQAIEAEIRRVAGSSAGFEVPVTVGVLPTKYPQGGEKQLIAVLTGHEVPSGGLPVDVGVVVHNVGTCAAVFDAVRHGRPLVERVVTVTGEGLKRPGNVRVRLGTPARLLVEHFGGMVGEVGKVVFGGPMMGVAQYNLEVPVIKGTSGILIIPRDHIDTDDIRPCIRCSACIEVCPIGLLPNMISVCAEMRAFGESEQYHPFDCIECGCCSYVCPSYRPLVQMIRFAKTEVQHLKAKH
ncbi:MAG: electron transport complex subunit RsxC [Nitrospirota bacterium]|nr:electron transport complex subunit RsxC [Nitrospirota bacterium]